jgi:hypothetical protein
MSYGPEEFRQEFQCVPWRASDISPELRALANRYHFLTERFDRAVCTGPIKDGAIRPGNSREQGKIARHAHDVRRRLFREGQQKGIVSDVAVWFKAIREAAYSFNYENYESERERRESDQ